ncbi:MAG TPA: SCO family protein [Chitinophagaceae bacterium]
MTKRFLGYGAFFLVLVLVFFFFVFSGTDEWKPKLATISYVKPFSFTTQEGKQFTDEGHLGKVTVVEYFFTTCTNICTRMNQNMKTIYEEFKDEPDFQILAITSMPESDSVGRLKHYSDSLGLNPRKWILLTGRKDSLYKTARVSYLLDDPKLPLTNIEDQFIHTQFFALVDKNGKVRGQVYDGLKEEEIGWLKRDIRRLLNEKQGGNGAPNLFTTPK